MKPILSFSFTAGSFAVSAFALSLAASAAHAQIVVRTGPPAPLAETVPAPPPEHPYWAWHAGFYRYDGARYVWVPGSFVNPPYARAHWVEGHWARRHGGWVWREGHWS